VEERGENVKLAPRSTDEVFLSFWALIGEGAYSDFPALHLTHSLAKEISQSLSAHYSSASSSPLYNQHAWTYNT
jgi:hypothetical protein